MRLPVVAGAVCLFGTTALCPVPPLPSGGRLAATNITITPNPDLHNAGIGQVVGQPAARGLDPATTTWTLQDARLDPRAITDDGMPPRYAINALTGQITQVLPLSGMQLDRATKSLVPYQDDLLIVSATDGTRTVTRAFTVRVTDYQGPTYHVGRGQAAAHPDGTGFDTWADAWLAAWAYRDAHGLCGPGCTFKLYADQTDPDYFANALADPRLTSLPNGNGNPETASLRGPFKVVGVPYVDGQGRSVMPYFGGRHGHVNEGYDRTEIGPRGGLNVGHGDMLVQGMDIGWVTSGSPANDDIRGNGLYAIRKNNATHGNLLILGCHIHDSDTLVLTGSSTGTTYVVDTRLSGSGSAYDGGGCWHGFYGGPQHEIYADNVFSDHAHLGHTFRSRAFNTVIRNCRFFDGERGMASRNLEISNGGTALVEDCVLHRGPMSQQAQMLAINNGEGYRGRLDVTVRNCTFINTGPNQGVEYGAAAGVFAYTTMNDDGTDPVVRVEGCSFFGVTQPVSHPGLWGKNGVADSGHDHAPVVTGTVTLATMPDLDHSSPVPGNAYVPRTGPSIWTNDASDYHLFVSRTQIDTDQDHVVVSGSAASGTVLETLTPTGNAIYNDPLTWPSQPDPRINPFAGGYTLTLDRTPLQPYTGGSYDVFAPAGYFAVADGNKLVKQAASVPAGLYLVRLRATATTGGAQATCIHYVKVT